MSTPNIPNLNSLFATTVEDWLPALAVVAGTLVAHYLVRTTLRRIAQHPRWKFIRELAPSISNLVYIFGLQIFAETAPLHTQVERYLEHFTYILGVLVLIGLARRAILLGIEWSAPRASHSDTLQEGFVPLARNLVTVFVFLSGGIMLLKHFNYDVMSLVAALGVGSLAVGLAAQPTLSNMISGFTLIIDGNLKPGDRIQIGGFTGDVEVIGLRSTQIKTLDGHILIVPNADLVNSKLVNLTMVSRGATCSTILRVSYETSFERARQICLEAMEKLGYRDEAKSRWVNLVNLSEGHQQISAGFWLEDVAKQGDAMTEFHVRVLARLREEKIELLPPLPELKSRAPSA